MDFFGNDGTLESIQTMGIVNSLKTGNVLLDMTIAMMIPIVLGMAFSTLSKAQEMLSKVNWMSYFRKPSKQYSRSICHKTIQTPYSTVDMGSGDSQNETLIKAIQLYLHHHSVLQKLNNARMELQSFGKKEERSYYYYGDSDSKSNSFADTLSKYQVVKKPYSGTWISLGNFKNQVVRASDETVVTSKGRNDASDDTNGTGKGCNQSTTSKNKDQQPSNEEYEVDMVIEETKHDLGDGKQSSDVTQKKELTLRFRSDGKYSIDNFIDTAYQWYLNELRKMEDDSRYLYELIVNEKPLSSSSEDGEDTHRKYKRYMLSEEKTFDSLFFQEKNGIVKLVDHFVNKTGKYAIKGYPNKLGLLLHGPPGTGKTSLIKALAQYTNRSIVNVPLARISTNAELSSLFFDQKYYVDGERVPVNLNFKDVIFVMEDVDAVSKIVRRRDGKKTSDVTYREPVDLPTTKSMWKMLVESTNPNCTELVKLLMEKSERLATEAKQSSILCNAAKKMSVVPGINYVGQDPDNAAMKAITQDALKSAQQLMNEYQTVDTFLGTHAQSLKQMIEGGTEISTEFENELLGLNHNVTSLPTCSPLALGPNTQSLSREVSITQDQEQDAVIVDSIKGGFLKEGDDADIDDALLYELKDEQDAKGSKEKTIGPTFNKWKKDELNLSGLLNVLDGVVDTPGRMLIMTTNHPEVLDPALIRPGRIDKKLLLSYMKYQDIASMIEHYFQTTLSQEDVERLRIAINGDAGAASTSSISNKPSVKLTPAQVEQMAAEYDEVDEMISAIEDKSKSILGRHQFNRVPQVTFNT